jgi:hypothetical protein
MNISCSTLFSNILSLFNVIDQVSHPYKASGKIKNSVYQNLNIFGYELEQNCLDWIEAGFPQVQSAHNSSRIQYSFVIVVPKYWKFVTISKGLLPILCCNSAFYSRGVYIYSALSALTSNHHRYQRITKLLCFSALYVCSHVFTE